MHPVRRTAQPSDQGTARRPRIVFVRATDGLVALNSVVELMRDLGRPRGDMWEAVRARHAGTLTVGQPKLVDVVTAEGVIEAELLGLTASGEQWSERPIAEAIVEHAREKCVALSDPAGFEVIAGHGLRATVQGRQLLIGTAKLMRDREVALGALAARGAELQGARRTIVYSAWRDPPLRRPGGAGWPGAARPPPPPSDLDGP